MSQIMICVAIRGDMTAQTAIQDMRKKFEDCEIMTIAVYDGAKHHFDRPHSDSLINTNTKLNCTLTTERIYLQFESHPVDVKRLVKVLGYVSEFHAPSPTVVGHLATLKKKVVE